MSANADAFCGYKSKVFNYIILETGLAQLVEHWSPKPGVGSSSLSTRAKVRIMNIVSYVKESFSELKEHVSWTPLPELSNLTVIVLLFSIIFALIIWFADSILSRVIKFYFEFIN